MNKMIEITSAKNPTIKEIKTLYKRKNRWEHNLFIIEGIKIIDESISNNIDIKYMVYTDKLLNTKEGVEFFQRIKDRKELIKVDDSIFKEICDTDNPQGILAIARFKERSLKNIYELNRPFLLFLDKLQDPGNLGTIIRTADAFNIDGIILGKGSVDPYNPKVVRSTMGSIFRVPLYFCENTLECLGNVKNHGIEIIATSLKGVPIYNADFGKGFVLVIGNEAKGVSDDISSIASRSIKIPMPGGSESLNAGVAASIIMYEAMRCRS